MPVVVKEKCPQNHRCPLLKLCPVEAIIQEGFDAPVILKDKCLECGICIDSCPSRALTNNTDYVSSSKEQAIFG